MNNIEKHYGKIYNGLFLRGCNLDYMNFAPMFTALACAINAEPETDWSLGEFKEAALDDLIIGAFWHFTEWHRGQNSSEYTALCCLGAIYSPGCETGPDSPGSIAVYQQLERLAEKEAA